MALAVRGVRRRDRPGPARLRDVASVAGRYTQVERADGRCGCCWPRTRPAGWRRSTCWTRHRSGAAAVNAQVTRRQGHLLAVGRGLPCAAGAAGVRGRGARLDLAVRLEADQVPFDLVGGVDEAVDRVSGGRLTVIANYTAFQQIRVLWAGRADVAAGRPPAGAAERPDSPGPSALRLVWVTPTCSAPTGPGQPAGAAAPRPAARDRGRVGTGSTPTSRLPRQGDIYLLGGGEDLPQILACAAAARRRRAGGRRERRGVFAVCAGLPAARQRNSAARRRQRCRLEILTSAAAGATARGGGDPRRRVPRAGRCRAHRIREPPGRHRLGPGVARWPGRYGVGNGDGTEGACAAG
jgi:hypothetical protein